MTTILKLPEITAKAYANSNQLSVDTVQKMCRSGVLPARKLDGDFKEIDLTGADKYRRGTWWINLTKLEKQLAVE